MAPKDENERLGFVRKVDALRASGRTIDAAIAEVSGNAPAPSSDQYLEWKGLIDLMERKSKLPTTEGNPLLIVLAWLMRFVSSGFFFMIVGCAFIFVAAEYHGAQHTAFTFILAVLGIAILLFGTGTQSAGRLASKEESDWKIQGSLAGGAGVLAFLCGWALLTKHEDMRKAFDSQTRYMMVSLEMTDQATRRPVLVRDRFLLQPANGFSPVPVTTGDSHFDILIPYETHNRPCSIRLSTVLHAVDDLNAKLLTGSQRRYVEYFEVVLPDGASCRKDSVTGAEPSQTADVSETLAANSARPDRFRQIPLDKDNSEGSDIERFTAEISFVGLVTEAAVPIVQIIPDAPGASAEATQANAFFK